MGAGIVGVSMVMVGVGECGRLDPRQAFIARHRQTVNGINLRKGWDICDYLERETHRVKQAQARVGLKADRG